MNTTRTRPTLATLKPAALVLAGVLAGSMFSELLRPATALAQGGSQDNKTLPPEKILNSAEQTMKIATGIAQINERLARIESALTLGIKVKVTEMPASSSKDASK